MSGTKFYGLTGGIGSGKSTVAQMFHDLAVPTLDLDKIGKEVLNHTNIQKQLTQAFGLAILQEHGIDTSRLRTIAFSSQANTKKLNTIMHPAIQQVETMWREQQSAPIAIIEASVLIESGGVKRMNGLLVVLADLEKRKQRVLARGMQDKAAFEAIIHQQCSDIERIKLAGFIIENNDSLQALRTSVTQLYKQL